MLLKQLIKENNLKCRITSYTNLVCELLLLLIKNFSKQLEKKKQKDIFKLLIILLQIIKI